MRHIWMCLPVALCYPAMAQSLPAPVREALQNNREILAAQKGYEAARQRPSMASSLPDPTVSLGYTSNGTPLPGGGLGTNPTSNAGEIAEKEAEAEFQQYLSVRLSVAAGLKMAYHELHHAYVSIDSIKRSQELLRTFMRVTEARYSVGRAAQQDVLRADTQYAILETRAVRLEEEKAAKDEDAPPLKAALEDLNAYARTEAPMLRREQKMVERGELSTNLARKEYDPDYTISGGYFNQGSMPPMFQPRVDFKLPAYFWRKQRAGVNEQVFALSEARHNYEASAQLLNARIKEYYVTAQSARKLMDLYAKSVIPEARLALESSMAGYETGALDALSVLTNFMTVVDYELNYHEELMRYVAALDRLEEMTGMELDTTGEVSK